MKRALLALAFWVAGAATQPAAQGVLRVEASEPRAYGYQVGDRVQRHVTVHAPEGWTLDTDSVPRPGGRGRALELHRVASSTQSEAGGRRHEFELEYQVFLAPPSVRTLEIAPFRLRFQGATRVEEVLVEAWPVTVAPLAPALAPTRRGLGELQPDRPPPAIDTAALRTRLVAYAVTAALLGGALVLVYLGPPWRLARNRPFGVAWRQLRRLPADAADAQWRAACRQLHEALNRSAGEVLFERGLDGFIAAHPGFSALREDLSRFLRLSRDEFFGGASRAAGDAAWLVALCRRCRDAERGLA